MANDLNLCQFIGRLSRDPETRFTPGGESVTSFSLAVGSTWKDKSGAKQESTEWVNVTAFGKLSEIISQYCTKGTQMHLSGRMKTDKYTDKNGVEKYSTKIIASNMQLLGGKLDAQKPSESAPRTQQKEGGASGFDDLDNDIPF